MYERLDAVGRPPMLRDGYDPIKLFELVPALEMRTDGMLMQLDTLLDDDTLFQAVKADLARRCPTR